MSVKNKFFATSATAALVASAIVPVASAAQFNDADQIPTWAQEAVEALVNDEVLQGSNGNFNPNGIVTRAQAAEILYKALDLSAEGTEDFSDVKPGDWFYNAVLATSPEIFEGDDQGKFDPKGELTREQAAAVIVRAFGLTGEADLSVYPDASKVSGWAKEAMAIAVENGVIKGKGENLAPKSSISRAEIATMVHRTIEAAGNEEEEVTVKSAVATDEKTVEVTLSNGTVETITLDEALKANVATDITFTIDGVEYTATVTYEVEDVDLVVESVSAINNKEILVTFNKELDKTSAETVANYTLSNADLGAVTPKLSDDKKSVILTVATAASQQATTDVTIKNVKDLDGKVVAETKKKVTFLDTTLPTATSVEVTGPKTLKVNFSEPMQTLPTFKLNGGAYSVTPVLAADGKSATLTLGAVLPTEEHTLEVAGGTDYSSASGFAIIKQELKFNYAVDTTVPTAVIEKATETKVTLKFSKPVSTTNLNGDVTAYHSINNSANYIGTIAAVDAVNGFADTFEVTFTTPIPAGTGKVLYLNTKENKFEDQWGNDVTSSTFKFDVVSDTVAPTVTKVEATGKDATAQKELTITLSEEVVKEDAENRVNYVLKDAQGNIVKTSDYAGVDSKGNFTGATFAYDKSKNEVKISLGTVLKAGSYKLEVANIKDVSFAGNKMTSQVVDVTVADTIAPTVAGITHDYANRAIFVNFSEAMNNTDLADESNYFLLIGSTSKELPTGSTVEVVSPQKVKITLPANATSPTSGDTVKVQVKGAVKDAAGNAIGGLFGESTDSIAWGTASTFTITPAAGQVKLVAKNQLQFELPTELTAIDSTKFTVNAAGTPDVASATYVNNSGKSTVTVTLNKDLVNSDLSDITNLEIAADGLTNSEGLKLNSTATFTAATHFEDKLAASIVSVEITSADTIKVTFSEAIPAGEIANATFTVAGNTVNFVSHTGGQKEAVITLKDAIETGETPKVSQVLDIKDVRGNILTAGTTVVDTEDKRQ